MDGATTVIGLLAKHSARHTGTTLSGFCLSICVCVCWSKACDSTLIIYFKYVIAEIPKAIFVYACMMLY